MSTDPAEIEDTPQKVEGREISETQPQDQQGAYNEETGEINWDCPCLGGMAQGPCGETFKGIMIV